MGVYTARFVQFLAGFVLDAGLVARVFMGWQLSRDYFVLAGVVGFLFFYEWWQVVLLTAWGCGRRWCGMAVCLGLGWVLFGVAVRG